MATHTNLFSDPQGRGEHVFLSYARQCQAGHERAIAVQRELEARGLPVWRDQTDIEAGDNWLDVLPSALSSAQALVCVLSPGLELSTWVPRELLQAEASGIPIIPLRFDADGRPPFQLAEIEPTDLTAWPSVDWQKLIQTIERRWSGLSGTPQRRVEIAYLKRLLFGELPDLPRLYTRLTGERRVTPGVARMISSAQFRPVGLELLRRAPDPHHDKVEPVADVFEAIVQTQRLAVLGAPGGGKTFTLGRAVYALAERALAHPDAPLPLFVPLKSWLDDGVSLESHIATATGLAPSLITSLHGSGRAALFLDGLNEVAGETRAEKIKAVHSAAADRRWHTLMLSCRKDDYVDALRTELDRLELHPLKPLQVRDFISGYFPDTSDAEALFWHLAGGDDVRRVYERWLEFGASTEAFWTVEDMEAEVPDVYAQTTGDEDVIWRRVRSDTRALLHLAETPYLLALLIDLYAAEGGLAALSGGQAALIGRFIRQTLARENLLHETSHDGAPHPGFAGAHAALGRLAWDMMRASGNPEAPQVAATIAQLNANLTPDQQAIARGANLLQGAEPVSFAHQLLQEYFVALGLWQQIQADTVRAHQIWPGNAWWARTGWEQATRFVPGVAGSDEESATPALPENVLQSLVNWLGFAQPLMLAEALCEPDAPPLDEATGAQLRHLWMSRLHPDNEPAPEARHAVASALALLNLDDRRGVGVSNKGLPDIEWIEIPGGPFIYQDGETLELPTFWMSRYTITNAQWMAFEQAEDHDDARWWDGFERPSPAQSTWPHANRPRTDVSWFEALAFCRWLSANLGYEVRLPLEAEWEKAARGTDGHIYPWGEAFVAGHANVNETWGDAGPHSLNETTAVGLYPHGQSPCLLVDMAGNVWEWCLNRYSGDAQDYDAAMVLDESGSRVLRGGSWVGGPGLARAVVRGNDFPDGRGDNVGFRVLSSSPILIR